MTMGVGGGVGAGAAQETKFIFAVLLLVIVFIVILFTFLQSFFSLSFSSSRISWVVLVPPRLHSFIRSNQATMKMKK